MSKIDVVLGTQFGDEGKGRIVSHLCATGKYHSCARVNGSDNAGHTAHLENGEKIAFNQVPIGALYGLECVIARGCVIDLAKLDAEVEKIDSLVKAYHRDENWSLSLDSRCHVKTQAHRDRDASEESSRSNPIGTTLSGNGPAYADKYTRSNKRVCDVDLEEFRNIYRHVNVMDTSDLHLGDCLVEAAHGIMLDIDHGTYPFVTSSACTAASACHSLGVSPKLIDRIIGVAKPYITRVGAGAFPTEIQGEITTNIIRERGHEYGTNTKRARRIGWLDIPALEYAVDVSGVEEIAICKLDVLDSLDSISVCIAYEGEASPPPNDDEYRKVIPIYREIKWNTLGMIELIKIIEETTEASVSLTANEESIMTRK